MLKTIVERCRRFYISSSHPDKVLLLRFLKVYDFNMEKAKELLILNLEMRKKNPMLFDNRDVMSPEFQQTFRTMQASVIEL